MNERFGKLILINTEGPDQEFELAKSSVSLGRAATNDITINDTRVSRAHARLDNEETGLTLVDLGSANGTWVNGRRVGRATLVPGDTLGLGSHQFKYSVEDPSQDVGITKIDTQVELNENLEEDFLPMVINETRNPSLVIRNDERTWKVELKDLDHALIGRDESCEVHLDAENVSRRHAEVQRRGDQFLLKDLGSANGVWHRSERIEEHLLEDGDSFQIGPAQIVFKKGFDDQALTLVGQPALTPAGRRTVIFVPGLMGSELWLGNDRVWPSLKAFFSNPDMFVLPSDIPLEPRKIVDEVVIVPNLIKQDQYNRLGDYLVDELEFQREVNFIEFPYDWRQDLRESAAKLGKRIEEIPLDQPIVIVGHSLGTLVTRYYVEVLGADPRVERIILMGGPHKGTVKALVGMLEAPEVLPFGLMGERIRRVMMTFPSSYQILPEYPVGKDQHGRPVNFLEDEGWLEEDFHPLLKNGLAFRQELNPGQAVPAVSIFGYGIKTMASVSVMRDEGGTLKNLGYRSEPAGDGGILEESAILEGSEIHPVHQHHGSLFVDNDVKMRLKIELTRPFEG